MKKSFGVGKGQSRGGEERGTVKPSATEVAQVFVFAQEAPEHVQRLPRRRVHGHLAASLQEGTVSGSDARYAHASRTRTRTRTGVGVRVRILTPTAGPAGHTTTTQN